MSPPIKEYWKQAFGDIEVWANAGAREQVRSRDWEEDVGETVGPVTEMQGERTSLGAQETWWIMIPLSGVTKASLHCFKCYEIRADGFCLRVTDCKMGSGVTALNELTVGEHLPIINMVWAPTMCQGTLCFLYVLWEKTQTFSAIPEHAAWVNNTVIWEEVVRAMIWQMSCGLNDEPLLATEVGKENHSRQRTSKVL